MSPGIKDAYAFVNFINELTDSITDLLNFQKRGFDIVSPIQIYDRKLAGLVICENSGDAGIPPEFTVVELIVIIPKGFNWDPCGNLEVITKMEWDTCVKNLVLTSSFKSTTEFKPAEDKQLFFAKRQLEAIEQLKKVMGGIFNINTEIPQHGWEELYAEKQVTYTISPE
ncbi:MAG: hypothetical protein WC087_03080 [Candidatus Paceibacterota bacterium]